MPASLKVPTAMRRITEGVDRIDVPAGPLAEAFEQLEARFPGIKSRVLDDATGDIHPFEQLTGVPYDPEQVKLYLCGSDAMIKQVTDYAVNERGFDRKDIVHEKFFD